jgi:AraC-like DNA-binding protein
MFDSIYTEAPATADLARHVQCVWYRRVGENGATRPLRVLPDGCMDLMWMNGGLIVAGPDTRAHISHRSAGTEIIALRFRPGAALPVLGVQAVELIDARVAAATVWGRSATEITARLDAIRHPAEAAEVLHSVVRRRLAAAPELDSIVQQLVASVQRAGGDPSLRVEQLADELGISERQLHRRCSAALGYGPKAFARIVRFQRFAEHARSATSRSLSELAAHAGYADQSHLTREVRRLSGISPAALVAELAR